MKRLPPAPFAALVLLVGSLQILGWATGWNGLRRFGQMTAAAPLPLVFSSHQGWESFSPRFLIDVLYRDGSMQHAPVDPALYSRLPGPYNRRNIYGAVIAFGPLMEEGKMRAMRDAVLLYSVCNEGPIARLAERPKEVAGAIFTAAPRHPDSLYDVWSAEVKCTP